MSFTGKKFPSITVTAINNKGANFDINIFEKARAEKKKVLLFWYPKDFTFVCPTELHAFQAALGEFEKRNNLVIGASCPYSVGISTSSSSLGENVYVLTFLTLSKYGVRCPVFVRVLNGS